ncbi:MAG: inorganic phosphate transporter [Planctomycetes bacterium]|nr:inorganic phosphate transporter [Planctomycetota bacterium]
MDFAIIVSIIAVALLFDFVNGMNDAANSISTVVSTRVLSPQSAVVWAAFFNFIAFLFFGLHVANAIGKGLVHPDAINIAVITAGLLGANIWTILATYWGVPVSCSHALVGGLVGAAVTHAGLKVVVVSGVLKICLFIVISPLAGLLLGYALMVIVRFLFHNSSPAKINKHFRRLQLVSAASYSLGHGGNDAQKTMGIIAVLLFTWQSKVAQEAGLPLPKFEVALWVVLACHAAMGLGTLLGGWRVVKTMGQKITQLQPVGGFCAETAGAAMLFAATFLGIPVSTTHTITGSIIGVGATRRLSAVRWGIAQKVVWAWILTIPAAAAVSALSYLILKHLI